MPHLDLTPEELSMLYTAIKAKSQWPGQALVYAELCVKLFEATHTEPSCPSRGDWRADWPLFVAECLNRLEEGALQYKDRNLNHPPEWYAQQAMEEQEDSFIYEFLRWRRLRRQAKVT